MSEIYKIEPTQWQIILQLLLAIVLGGLIGLEREYRQRAAGIKTYTLVCLASALFTILSMQAFDAFWIRTAFNPAQIISSILIGIGFIGAGVIVKRAEKIEGITTAAGLWITTAIGIGVGCGWYVVSIITTFLVMILLLILRKVDLWFDRFDQRREKKL